MKYSTLTLSLLFFLLTSMAWAEHLGIATTHRDAIQKAMGKQIEKLTDLNGNGKFPMYDPETRSLVQLEFKAFHDSVEIKGRKYPYFVSCADFVAPDGTLYDLDFFVSKNYDVVATLVHAKNGIHTAYDVH
jgi:hypothetical protein